MFIDAPLGSGKTDLIAKKYSELISSGAKTSEIIVLCNNQPNRTKLLEKIRIRLSEQNFEGGADLKVYTFNGLVRNTITSNWVLFENLIPQNFGHPEISPEMGGMGNSLFLMNKCCERANFADYRSGLNLMHQLMRRYTLIVNNNLSKEEIKQKSQLLGETFFEDANTAIETFKKYTLKYRMFDYLRQTDAFYSMYKSGKINDFNNIKHLLVNNLDEFTYIGFKFVEALLEKTNSHLITFDSEGSSRRGYLCAYPDGVKKLCQKYEVKKIKRPDQAAKNAEILFNNLTGQQISSLDNLEISSFTYKQEMLENLIKKIDELLKTTSPKDIKIITTEDDEITNYFIKKYLDEKNIKSRFLSGTKRIYEDKACFCSLIILILCEQTATPSKTEIKKLCSDLLNLPNTLCSQISETFAKQKQLPDNIDADNKTQEDYKKILTIITNLKEKEISQIDKLLMIFKQAILPHMKEYDNFDKFNMLIKSLEEFYTLKNRAQNDFKLTFNDWLAQMRINIVSDNPSIEENFEDNELIISSPQKIIDNELKSKYQIWFDVTSRNWIKEDTGTLYNAWVFQHNFEHKEYTIDLHKELTLKKTAAVLRKLMLCSEEKVILLSSRFDTLGNENRGELLNFLLPEKSQITINNNKITPREDQKPILEYKGGKMAVPAVPGAGKTTIMLALIIKLIERGANPSEILVLTYMESAATNFLNRIKNMTNLKEMPQISTIHGLAYKIIQDEDNCSRIGLSDNFEICDELKKNMILRQICASKLPPGEQLQDWMDYCLKNISKAKSLLLSPQDIENSELFEKDNQIKEFLSVYKEYAKTLKSNNSLDYDDMLIFANELIDKYSDIRKYYQNKFKFIIEDEAQDSSPIQQQLINAISSKHSNVVRCGDLNQAIMSTFTNADIEGFKKFINENKKIEMQSSQRCCKAVYTLANLFVKETCKTKEFHDAFYQLEMKPVEGQNPKTEPQAVKIQTHDTNSIEMAYICEEVKKLQQTTPERTCAILLRTNNQISNWMAYLENNGINTFSRTETLKNKKVFKLLSKLLEFVYFPLKNNTVQDLAIIFKENNIISLKKSDINQIKNISEAFMSSEPQNPELIQLWWELYYWMELPFDNEEEFIIKAGNHYFTKSDDLSNVNLICSIIRNFKRSYRNYTQEEPSPKDILSHLTNIGIKQKLSGIKYFNDLEDEKITLKNGVELMTVHKSKGDEFDIVFMPDMTEFNYNIDPGEIKLNKQTAIVQKLEHIAGKKPKNDTELKLEQAKETLRLIYVGITRAKRKLYLSASEKQKNFSKPNKPSSALIILDSLLEKEVPIC